MHYAKLAEIRRAVDYDDSYDADETLRRLAGLDPALEREVLDAFADFDFPDYDER